VTVSHRASGLAATWYPSEAGGVGSTGAAATDINGRAPIWLERGAYKVSLSGGNPTIAAREEMVDIVPGKDGGVDTNWLSDSAVTTAKIANANVTEPKYATDSVSTRALAPNAVTSDQDTDLAGKYLKRASGTFVPLMYGPFTTLLSFGGGSNVTSDVALGSAILTGNPHGALDWMIWHDTQIGDSGTDTGWGSGQGYVNFQRLTDSSIRVHGTRQGNTFAYIRVNFVVVRFTTP
jgi:hypothetical protein